MYNFKKLFTYMVVGALVMALSISCKSNEEPQETGSTSPYHPSQGSYTNTSWKTGATVTINDNGTCTIAGTAVFGNTGQTQPQTFSITVTKWWYEYDTPDDYNAGSSYEKSEATIDSPITDYFSVYYNRRGSDENLFISFGHEGKRYNTYYLNKIK